jgi:hypothetical protein
MRLAFHFIVAAVVVLVSTFSALAFTSFGNNFDNKMSLVIDFNSGQVLIEDAPNANPSISSLVITSLSGGLLYPNLAVVTAPPTSLLFPAPHLSATANKIDLSWSGGNFIGTGASIGPVFNLQNPNLLFSDLTITYTPYGQSPLSGDLIFAAPGSTQRDPNMPTIIANGLFRFINAASGQFFDPPTTYGYTYAMEGASTFTKIGLPLGLGNNYTVTSAQGTVNNLAGGGMLNFSGAGVSSFQITGINPLVDGTQPNAFPVYLEFSTPTADFNMQSLDIPEPSTAALLMIAANLIVGGRRHRRSN